MPANVFQGGPCAYRYTDYPRPGSIYRLPDDMRLQRGPTLVRLPGGREVRVPATERRSLATASQGHDMNTAQSKMAMMMAILSGKSGLRPRVGNTHPLHDRRLGGTPDVSLGPQEGRET